MTWTRDNEERGRRVREARERKGFTQKQVAVAIGANPSTLSHIERGAIGITRDRADALAPILEVDADDLADVASPSMLYLVRAIAEKMEIPLRPQAPEAEDDPGDELPALREELDQLEAAPDAEERTSPPREETG